MSILHYNLHGNMEKLFRNRDMTVETLQAKTMPYKNGQTQRSDENPLLRGSWIKARGLQRSSSGIRYIEGPICDSKDW